MQTQPTDFLEDVRLEGNLISETEGGLVGASREDIKSGMEKDRRRQEPGVSGGRAGRAAESRNSCTFPAEQATLLKKECGTSTGGHGQEQGWERVAGGSCQNLES